MAIQNLPAFFDMPFTDKEGRLSPDAYLYHDQTFQALNAQLILSNGISSTHIQTAADPNIPKGSVVINGLNPPSKTTLEIATLFADANIPLGTIWYDRDIGKLKFKAGTLQTITSTP